MEDDGKKVMVVINDKDDSYAALMWVLDNLGSSLVSERQLLIFATELPPNYSNIFAANLSTARLYATVNPSQEFVSSMQELEKKVVIGILEKAKSICTSRGINAETILEVGDPKTEICGAVEKYNVGLLVLPEENLGILKGTFLWSVSDYCVRYAKCPVLVVKNPDL